MGVDIALHVVNMESEFPAMALAHARVPLDRDYRLQDRIDEISQKSPAAAIAGGVYGFFGDHYGRLPATDPYGQPVEWVAAADLAEAMRGDLSPWNAAALAFVSALPSATKIILWYH